VTGDPIVDLRVTADAPDAHIFAYLETVTPDGHTRVLTEGRLRAALGVGNPAPFRVPGTPWHRAHASDVLPLTPTEIRHVRFAMLPVSAVIPAGHRLRLVIRTTDYRERTHTDTPVELTVASGGQLGSTLIVPFVEPQDSAL
jgi:predicted acyl esterase